MLLLPLPDAAPLLRGGEGGLLPLLLLLPSPDAAPLLMLCARARGKIKEGCCRCCCCCPHPRRGAAADAARAREREGEEGLLPLMLLLPREQVTCR